MTGDPLCQGCLPAALHGYFAAGGRDVGMGPSLLKAGSHPSLHLLETIYSGRKGMHDAQPLMWVQRGNDAES